MAADGHTNNFQGLKSFLNIQFSLFLLSSFFFFFQKMQYKVQNLEIHLIQK